MHIEAKVPLGDNCMKKNNRWERRIRNPHTQTPNISQANTDNRSSKGGNRKTQIWTELCRLNPGGSIVRERFKFNFFCLSRTTSWSRRSHGASCPARGASTEAGGSYGCCSSFWHLLVIIFWKKKVNTLCVGWMEECEKEQSLRRVTFTPFGNRTHIP